jgi:hypothetical protein
VRVQSVCECKSRAAARVPLARGGEAQGVAVWQRVPGDLSGRCGVPLREMTTVRRGLPVAGFVSVGVSVRVPQGLQCKTKKLARPPDLLTNQIV